MSDRVIGRTLRRVWASALLAGLAPVAIGAQTAAEYREELARIEPQWRAATAAVAAAESERRATVRAVNIERGSLRIVADSVLAERTIAAADIAAREVDATFGASARLLADVPIIIRTTLELRRGDTTRVISVRVGRRATTVTTSNPADTHDQLVAVLRGPTVVAPIHAALDDSLRAWFRAALPVGGQSRAELTAAYIELVTASTDLSRRCQAGDILGCRQLLLLSPSSDRIVEGFTATTRRAIVRANAGQLRTGRTAVEFDRCVRESDDTACIGRLRVLPPEMLRTSISSASLRRSFARSVLERGGHDAHSLLRNSHALPLDARFAVVGAAPVDSLVSAWRASVLAARPRSSSVTPATALATLAWIAAWAALALRSSRWR